MFASATHPISTTTPKMLIVISHNVTDNCCMGTTSQTNLGTGGGDKRSRPPASDGIFHVRGEGSPAPPFDMCTTPTHKRPRKPPCLVRRHNRKSTRLHSIHLS